MGGIDGKYAFCAEQQLPDCADDADKHRQLEKHGDGAQEGVVALLFVQGLVFFCDGVFVAVVLEGQAVQRGHKADHFQAVAVGPERYWEQNHLSEKSKKSNRQTIVA